MRKRQQTQIRNPYVIDKADLEFPLSVGRLIIQTRQSDKTPTVITRLKYTPRRWWSSARRCASTPTGR